MDIYVPASSDGRYKGNSFQRDVLFIMLINLQLTKKKKIKKLENFQKQSVIYATLINIIIEFLIINIYY